MGLAIAILVVALLLAGFLSLTFLEARSGRRVFAQERSRLDADVSAMSERIQNGRLMLDAKHALRVHAEHLMHDVAHVVLVSVRFVERTLTRATRSLRARREARAAALHGTTTESSQVE